MFQKKELITRKRKAKLPLFFPVYQPKSNLVSIDDIKEHFTIDGMIVNGFFLYKDAETKRLLLEEKSLHEYIGFDGIIMTDSGAFQGLKRPLFLNNKKIVKFQDAIGADIVSPLDHISPPGENRTTAGKKLKSTNKRIREAKKLVENGILAGVQQGGKFRELRDESTTFLMELGVEYIAIGSLVPFFNKNHNLAFVTKIITDARKIIGDEIPMHIYGAGDPVELPFFVALGADIFDSSSYGHYAIGGWYMTKYGALKLERESLIRDYNCSCKICVGEKDNLIAKISDVKNLAFHNLYTILHIIDKIREALEAEKLHEMLQDILSTHQKWFVDSQLESSWVDSFGK